jgi:hypothetical protein
VFPNVFPDKHEADYSQKPMLTLAEIAQQFGLIVTYDSLEGAELLSRESLLQLLEHSCVLARDQGGCRFLQ